MPRATMVAAILAGGSGKRFWPLSSPDQPKQFLRIAGDESMIQATWQRLDGLVPPERRLVITSADHAEQVREHLGDIPEENLIGEPVPRDTAAAAILGAALAERQWPGSVVLTLPADHLIDPCNEFQCLVEHAAELAAREQVLCTIGIPPTCASESYGYIERGAPLEIGGNLRAFHVDRFAEKPDAETASAYLAGGQFYWNAGIFIWPASVLLEEAAARMPDHHGPIVAAARTWRTGDWPAALARGYENLEKISIDYGIMEHTRRAAVVEAEFSWSDLGGWVALGALLDGDSESNQVRGHAVLEDCRGNVVFNAPGERPIVCIGIEDTVVVHTEHGVLVCPKDRIEQIRKAVERAHGK
jgi:mannose-1-phosphate guanylyltransferase